MFKVGDLVRRKQEHIGAGPLDRLIWPHGDKICRVVDVLPTDSTADATLIRVDIERDFKVARCFESAAPMPLWRDRLFADLRAAGASHEAATEFVTHAPSYEHIAEEYRFGAEGVVDMMCVWHLTTQGEDYWEVVHHAHKRNCGAKP